MQPEVDAMLMGLAGHLAGSVAPHLDGAYAGGSLNIIAANMLFAAQEYDRAAAIRADENAALRTLFGDLAGRVGGSLGNQLREASEARDTSIRVSALNEGNAVLKALLITLQEVLEQSDEAWAAEANLRIWQMLVDFAAARPLMVP